VTEQLPEYICFIHFFISHMGSLDLMYRQEDTQ